MPSSRQIDENNISAVTARLIELILQIPHEERLTILKNIEKKYNKGQRGSSRESYFMDVVFATNDRAFKGFIQNISNEGILIESKGTFHVGQKLTMTFDLFNKKGPVKITGEIVRISPEGLGIKFSHPIQSLLGDDKGGFRLTKIQTTPPSKK
jgi:Tfp pilus assembly protein PilZ